MSLADQARDLMTAGAQMRREISGEPVQFYPRDGRQLFTLQAVVSQHPTAQDLVSGGFYFQPGMTLQIASSDFLTHKLEPEMFVDCRGQSMRIAPDGITAGLYNTRVVLVPRDAPGRR